MKDYGNGILASSPALAAIGASYLEQVKAEERRRALIRAAFRDGQQVPQETTWNISDRH